MRNLEQSVHGLNTQQHSGSPSKSIYHLLLSTRNDVYDTLASNTGMEQFHRVRFRHQLYESTSHPVEKLNDEDKCSLFIIYILYVQLHIFEFSFKQNVQLIPVTYVFGDIKAINSLQNTAKNEQIKIHFHSIVQTC